MFTTEDLEELTAAHQKRQELNQHIQQRTAVWVEITGEKKLPRTSQARTEVTVPDRQLYDPAVTELTVSFRWAENNRIGFGAEEGMSQRLIIIPKAFIFDTDGTYEQKLRTYKALQVELGLTEKTK